MRWHASQILCIGIEKEMPFDSHHRIFSIESRLMFIFLWNVKDRKNSSIGIGFHSYKPKSSEGIFPIEILSYENPTKFLQTKGGLTLCMDGSDLVVVPNSCDWCPVCSNTLIWSRLLRYFPAFPHHLRLHTLHTRETDACAPPWQPASGPALQLPWRFKAASGFPGPLQWYRWAR